jgi:hypothetical protein
MTVECTSSGCGGFRANGSGSGGRRACSWRAEPVNMRGLVRTDSREHLVRDLLPVSLQAVNRLCHRNNVVERQNIGNQVVVLDELALFVPNVLGDHVVATERDPLHKLIEPLAFICGRLNGVSEVGFVSLSEALDLTTPSGKALAGMLAVLPNLNVTFCGTG